MKEVERGDRRARLRAQLSPHREAFGPSVGGGKRPESEGAFGAGTVAANDEGGCGPWGFSRSSPSRTPAHSIARNRTVVCWTRSEPAHHAPGDRMSVVGQVCAKRYRHSKIPRGFAATIGRAANAARSTNERRLVILRSLMAGRESKACSLIYSPRPDSEGSRRGSRRRRPGERRSWSDV